MMTFDTSTVITIFVCLNLALTSVVKTKSKLFNKTTLNFTTLQENGGTFLTYIVCVCIHACMHAYIHTIKYMNAQCSGIY